MKLQKRFAAVLLCAIMTLMMLTACSGSSGPAPTKLEWANSRTKQYFDTKGVTPQEFTLTADITVSGQKAGLKFAVKGKFPTAATMNGGSIRLAARVQKVMLLPFGHAPAISCCRMRRA